MTTTARKIHWLAGPGYPVACSTSIVPTVADRPLWEYLDLYDPESHCRSCYLQAIKQVKAYAGALIYRLRSTLTVLEDVKAHYKLSVIPQETARTQVHRCLCDLRYILSTIRNNTYLWDCVDVRPYWSTYRRLVSTLESADLYLILPEQASLVSVIARMMRHQCKDLEASQSNRMRSER